ncbi:outer membrane beta-barrel protein [Thiohalospira sp.]|uniref:outer membrane beta-barrel protein n=1 Tax=Thiohalospira sp. TaxID=3080549 RepID=UPI0039809281
MHLKRWIIAAALVATSPLAAAQSSISMDDAWAGGGLNQNSLSGWDSAMGFQFFGGLDLSSLIDVDPRFALGAEVGYFDSGEFESSRWWGTRDFSGLWTTAVASWEFTPEFYALGRAGLDLGDDDGLMIGGGAGYRITDQLDVRGEYVIRDNIDSLQANALYRFGQ